MCKKLPICKVINLFVLKERGKQLSWMFLILSLFCFTESLHSQTTLINPATDGGFNLGNTFAANGWTAANEGTGPIKWTVGEAASGTTSVGATTASSTNVTLTAVNPNITEGQIVYGANILANTFVQSIVGTTLTLSQNATTTASGITLGFGKSTGGISVGTTQTTSASIAANTYSVALSAANPNISVGMAIAPVAGFIDTNTYVASINGTTLGLSKASINGNALAVAQTLSFTATASSISGNSAYISNDNGITNSYAGYSSNRTVYFYKDIAVPAGENAITLTFDVKSAPNSGAGWQVWAAPISQTVEGTNTQVTSPLTYGVTWPGATLISFNSNQQVATTRTTAFVPKNFAGTTFRLIFVWTNSSSAGTLPPAAIDNISLTSRTSEEIICAQSGLWSQTSTWDGGKVPTPVDVVILDNDNEVVMIDSRYSGSQDLILAGVNTLVQYALSNVIDEFTIANDLNLAASGARFNNHDGTNGKYLKLGHNLDVAQAARFDSNIGGTTAFQGRLNLNGSLLQTITIDPAGFVGGSLPGTNAFGNVAGALNQLEVTNTSTAASNIVWNANGVRIKSTLILTSGRINVTSGNRIVLGNFGSLNGNNFIIASGSGFTNGMVSKWIASSNTKEVQPGTEYPGTDNNAKPFWYPFINNTGLDRSLYLLPDANPATFGEVAVTYTDATTTTEGLSVADGSYTVNKRYNGSWAFSAPDSNAIPAGPTLTYAPNASTPTNRVGVYASGAFQAIDGSSRLMNASAAIAGSHQEGTVNPFVFRKGLPFASLTSAPVYIGINDASALNMATAITSATSGNWNSTTTWAGGAIPTCGDVVIIANGHNVTVSSTANASSVIISKGGTLTNSASNMIVGCSINNSVFNNYGTHTMTGGFLKVNGSVVHKSGSFFNQAGGEIIIDSNNNGDTATSVAFGGTSCKIETSNLNLTGGKITIVDPLVNINSSTPISASSTGNYTLNTAGSTGTFTVNGGVTGSTVSITGVYNLFEVGQEISGNANIPAGTTITNISTGMVGFPPPVTLTLSASATATIPAGTPLNFSSMKNGGSTVVIEANAANANLAVGQGVSGPGIQAGTTITGLVFNGSGTNFLGKVTLSSPVLGLTTSPIDAQQTLTFNAVTEGSYSTVLSAANPSITAGMTVSGAGIKSGTFVADISGTSLTLSEPIQVGAPSPLVMNFHPFNTQSSGSFIYSSPNHYAAGLNHTLQIGDGISVQNTTDVTTGFNCQFQAAGGLLSLGNLIVDAPNGESRFMNVSSNNINNAYNMNVQNALTVTTGSVFKKTFANSVVYVGGNITNNGAIYFPSAGTSLQLGNLIDGIVTPTELPQTISGTGVWETNQWSLTKGPKTGYVLQTLTINNTNPAGVTLQVPNFRVWSTVNLTNGILHTSANYPIYCGIQEVVGSQYTGGSYSATNGGSDTTHIDGPCVHANSSSSLITQLRLFPVGKNGKYLPVFISSTGGVELMAEAFDSNSGTVNAANGSNLSTDRWKVTRVGTAGNFTGYNVRVGSSEITSGNNIVHSATENGVYDLASTPVSATSFDQAYFASPNIPTLYLATAQTGGFLGNFAYAKGPACSGTPAPGATIASSVSVCSGQSTILSLETATTGASVTYQWQSSTNGGSAWTNISNADEATYTAIIYGDTMYRCNVTCSSSTGSSTPVTVTVSASSAVVNNASICTSGIVNLTASGSTMLNWYDATSGGNLVATGTSFSPNVSTTTTYYVSSGSESSGSVNTGTYAGSSTSTTLFKGIAFDVNNNIKLKTVTVYPKNTVALTPITVALYDTNGNVVSGTAPVTFTPTLVTGTVGTTSQIVTLNYNIPIGKDYRLVATNGLVTSTNTLGNSTATITYPTGNALKLTGNVSALNDVISTTANITNCFHNLSYDEVCESVRVPVTATVVNTVAPTGTASQDTCLTGTIADFAVTGDSGATFTWYDAASLGNVLPTSTTVVQNNTYYVSQTVNGCEGPRLAIVAQGPCLGTNDFKIEGLKYYPNPVTDYLTITAKDAITKVEFYNLLGQLVKAQNVNDNRIEVDFNDLAASTYLVKVFSDQNVQLLRIIKK